MTKFKDLKANEVLSETQYYKLVKTSGDKAQLQNDNGENIVVDKNYVETCLTSASQFNDTKNITKTEAATLFTNNPYTAITVNFNKQVKESDVIKEIMDAYEGSTIKAMESAVKKAVKKGLSGEERTMVGKHSGGVDEFGRVHFTDMEIAKESGKSYDSRHRLVDSRTINWLIVKGVKYVVK